LNLRRIMVGPGRNEAPRRSPAAWAGVLLLLLGLTACRTARPPAPVDLAEPGWTVQQGQAVWTAARGSEGVAGELLLATRADGSCWVQFSKPPFNLFTAQRVGPGWHIEFQQGHKRYGGPGQPPARFIWFQLAKAAAGQTLDAGWTFTRDSAEHWVLNHAGRGERLEGYFAP
jgi:hypothetical protein